MNKPLISIITPTYNHERFIGQCIESVLAQSYLHWEQIIVDDGSTDATPQIVAQYRDPRIRYFRKEHEGIQKLSKSYNFALEKARGELIAILEGDDMWPAEKLENQIPVFRNKSVVLSWGRATFVDEAGNTVGYSARLNPNNPFYQNKPVGIAVKALIYENFLTPSVTVMVRKAPLLTIGGFSQPEGVPFVDYSTWLPLSLRGEFRYLDSMSGCWRLHSTQTTAKNCAGIMRGHVKALNVFLAVLPPETKYQLGIDEKLVRASNSWYEGLAFASEKQWGMARAFFIDTAKRAPFALKAKSLIAILASFFHLNWANMVHWYKRMQLHWMQCHKHQSVKNTGC